MQYRREIDGLRAVAVVPVICFHARLPFSHGGFIGVDIFFVISGYLITSILVADLQRGKSSIGRFYERRARRILPALFLVMGCSLPFAWLWMTAAQLDNFATSLVSVVLFCSNIVFWKKSGYFAPDAELQPMLHTWSLAVEEQYYMLFPIALKLLWPFGRRTVVMTICIVLLCSLGLSEWSWRFEPNANFFLFPPRAWELLVGSMCAFVLDKPERKQSELRSALGLGMIVGSMVVFTETTPTPSIYTLVPDVGAALIILYSGPETFVGRILAARLLVFIGMISYSAYLWHQPLLAFARLRSLNEPQPWLMGALALVSFPLAYASWRIVEQPFRRRSGGPVPNRQRVFAFAAAGAAAFIALGTYSLSEGGFPWRIREGVGQGGVPVGFPKARNCVRDFASVDSRPCTIGGRSEVRIAVVGDSHAAQWIPALQQASASRGWQFDVFSKIGCPFSAIKFTYDTLKREYWECDDWRSVALRRVASGSYDAVLFSSSTMGYTEYNVSDIVSADRWADGVGRTISSLRSSKVPIIVLIDNPQFRGFDPASCVEMALHFGVNASSRCSVDALSAVDVSARNREIAVLRTAGADILVFDDLFCGRGRCYPYRSGLLLVRDSNHISVNAALLLAPRITHEIEQVLRRQVAKRRMSASQPDCDEHALRHNHGCEPSGPTRSSATNSTDGLRSGL